jgi:hypothetical protein
MRIIAPLIKILGSAKTNVERRRGRDGLKTFAEL